MSESIVSYERSGAVVDGVEVKVPKADWCEVLVILLLEGKEVSRLALSRPHAEQLHRQLANALSPNECEFPTTSPHPQARCEDVTEPEPRALMLELDG